MIELLKTLGLLFYAFFRTGLLAVGGGLATIPFLYDISDKYHWFTELELADMIAVAESTPGAIGVNAATFAGYRAAGIPGALTATLALVLPSYVIVLIIANFLTKFKENKLVATTFSVLRPMTVGLIAAASLNIIGAALVTSTSFELTAGYFQQINPVSAALVAIFTFVIIKFKKHPLIYIAAGAVVGIGLGYAGVM